jgi:hypothetical protein
MFTAQRRQQLRESANLPKRSNDANPPITKSTKAKMKEPQGLSFGRQYCHA